MSKLHKKKRVISFTPELLRRAIKGGAKTVRDLAKIQQVHIILMGGGR